MPPKSPPLPPDVAHTPAMLSWRLDAHREILEEHASRLTKLESRPSLPDMSSPMWGRLLLAIGLLFVGITGHVPEAKDLALKLLGGH